MLLGQAPTGNASQLDLMRHIQAIPTHPAMLWPDIPKPLATLLMSMLAREAVMRPSIAEVRDVFQACITRRRRFTRNKGVAPLVRPLRVQPSVGRRMLGMVTALLSALAGAAAISS
jgi:hypothetical protein